MSKWLHRPEPMPESGAPPLCLHCPENWPCQAETLRAEARRALDGLPGLPWMARQILSAALGEEAG